MPFEVEQDPPEGTNQSDMGAALGSISSVLHRKPVSAVQLFIGDFVAITFALVGLIGFAVFVAWSGGAGYDGRIKDSCVAVWSASILLFCTLQLVIRLRFTPSGRCFIGMLLFVSMSYVILSFVTFLCYAIASFSVESFYFFCTFTVALLGFFAAVAPTPTTAEKPSCCTAALLWYNACNMCIALIFFVLLLVGSTVEAGVVSVPLRGKLMEAGPYQIAYNCEGPLNTGWPTIVLDCDGSHGMMDFWPLQKRLTESGRRSCIFDKPGIGKSDLLLATQKVHDHSNYYDAIINSFAEGANGKLTLLSWGGAMEQMFPYAARNAEKIESFVFLDVYYANVEWRQLAERKGITSQEELDTQRKSSLDSRSTLFSAIRGLGVPWGLMGLMVGGKAGYKMPERYEEWAWYYKQGKTWTTQYHYFSSLRADGEDPATTVKGKVNPLSKGEMSRDIPAALKNKPVLVLYHNRSREDVCDPRFPEYCEEAMFGEAFLAREAAESGAFTGKSWNAQCTEKDCSLSLVYEKPDWVARQIADDRWAVL